MNNRLAQRLDAIQSAGLPGAVLPTNIAVLIDRVLNYVVYGAGIVLLIFLISGGIQLMTSRGDPKGVQAAQIKITNAIIGIVIVLFSTIIVSVIGKIFGISIFTTIFGS